jgi:phenylacetate-coenzyme A ligase PaaK-like adenylate-forming protein
VLLRFDVGDLIRLRPPETPCACGRTDGIVADAVEGRVNDVTFDARGQLVTVDELDRRASGVNDVLEYQVTQNATDSWTVCAVCGRDGAIAELAAALGDLYGGRVAVALVAAIPAEVSGKHRLARCAASFSEAMFEGPMRAP